MPALLVPAGEPGPSSYQQPQQHQHPQHTHHQPHVHQQPPHQHQAQLHAHQAAAAAAAAAAAEAHQQQHVAMAQRAAELGGLAQFAPFPYAYGGYPAFWPTPYAIPYGPRGPGRGMPQRAAFVYHPAPMHFMGHQRPPPGTPGVSSGVQVRGLPSLRLMSNSTLCWGPQMSLAAGQRGGGQDFRPLQHETEYSRSWQRPTRLSNGV